MIIRDIQFLGPDRSEKMDAYLPAARFPHPSPAVLLIHGGGWRIGDKADDREVNIATQLSAAGYAVFPINYLLNEGCIDPTGKMRLSMIAWPQSLYDCKSALRFIRKESAVYGIDPGSIAVMGCSAGGSFALLLGATAQTEPLNTGGLYLDVDNTVSCVIDFYGPTEMEGRREYVFAGSTSEQTRENAWVASPLTWLHRQMPPILVVHGTADETVSIEESRMLVSNLQKIGAKHCYLEISDAPHTFHLQPHQIDLSPLVLSFLARHLGQTGVSSK